MGVGWFDLFWVSIVEVIFSELSLVLVECFFICDLLIILMNMIDSVVMFSGSLLFSDDGMDGYFIFVLIMFVLGLFEEVILIFDVVNVVFSEWLLGGVNWFDGDDVIMDYYILMVIYFVSIDEFFLLNSEVSVSMVEVGDNVIIIIYVNNKGVIGVISIIG